MLKLPRLSCALTAAAALVVAAPPLTAAVVDLTTLNSSGTVNGAVFQQSAEQPTGTGVINSFVRLQATGTERGYNSDFRPVQFDEKTDPNFNRSLLLSSLPTVNVGGTDYYRFLLDVNEPSSATQRLISLDELVIFQTNTADITGYNAATDTFSSPATKVYDLDQGSDSSITLDSRLNPGSGIGDMIALIPTSVFDASNGQYVVLYSQFGGTLAASAGFEEWATFGTATTPEVIPLPGALAMGLIGMGALSLRRQRC